MSGTKIPYKQIELDEEKVIKNIQDNLYKYRIKKDLSIRLLALKSGVEERYIYRIESGERKPSITTIIRLAKALDVSLDQLTGGINIEQEH